MQNYTHVEYKVDVYSAGSCIGTHMLFGEKSLQKILKDKYEIADEDLDARKWELDREENKLILASKDLEFYFQRVEITNTFMSHDLEAFFAGAEKGK